MNESIQPDPASAPRPGGKESKFRIGACLSGGAIAIYLATWTGAIAFHVTFQQPLLALERGPSHGVLWLQPAEGTPGDQEGWSTEELDGVPVPVPPGRIVEKKSEASSLSLKIEHSGQNGEARTCSLLIERRPTGFLKSVEREKLEFLGFKGGGSPSDASALTDIAQGSLQSYKFGWSEDARLRYAARLLVKMSLWDTGPISRFEIAHRGASTAALAGKPNGEARVIVADDRGVLIVTLAPEAPPAWLLPASWLGN